MKVELLAPAGSYEALEAAFEAGADAVYLGGQKFGARAYADNLDQEQLIRAIDLAHLRGKQLYLTINTLLKNRELEEELYAYLAPLYEAGLDAVIVQDLGVMEFIKTYFPKLHIHASTQMTITGVESAKLLKKAGATRVVTARELLLEEIKKIYDATHMEIESFVHGALCYCYSGQCLMSSMIGGRSGNRGRCAQPCRLPYQVYRDGKRLNNEQTAYALSPKDMCTVEILPEIIEAGVYSLKIEGRMKKPEYTAGVVSVYRKYLDRYLAGEKRPVVTEENRKILWDIYNRDGFHQSYYKQRNGRSMMALENEKSGGTIRNEELFSRIRKEYMEKKTPVPVQGTLTVYTGCPAILEVQAGDVSVTVEGETVQAATNCPLGEDRIRRQMEKTGGSGFAFEKLDIFMGDDIFLPMQQLNHLRRQALEALQKEMLRPWKQRKAKERDPKDVPDVKKQTAPGTLSAAVQTKEQLAAVAQTDGIRRIYADCGIFPVKDFAQDVEAWINRLQTAGKELFLTLPRIVRDRELDGRKETFTELVQKGLGGFMVRNMESYGILDTMGLTSRIVLDANIYTMNNRAEAFWMEKGILGDTVPLELNAKELAHRNNKNSELIVYGYTPMMVSVQCVQKTMDRCNHACAQYTLKDRYQKEFHGVCSCEFCYNTIYNALPTSLLKEKEKAEKLGVEAYRLSFTTETEKETEKIARAFVEVYLRGQKPDGWMQTEETTKGHFQRGVE